MQKDLEQRRRGTCCISCPAVAHPIYFLPDKIEDAKAKAAIRAQIEADKKARAERTAKEKALREGKIWTDTGAVDAPEIKPALPITASGTKGAEYKDTRLQVCQVIGNCDKCG